MKMLGAYCIVTESYTEPCYLYECVLALKALLLQKSAPNKYKQLISMQVNTRLEAELIVTSGSHQCCGAGASHSSDFV